MAIQRERWQGTLEIVLLAPTSRVAFVLGEALYGLVDGGWSVVLALLVTAFAFGAHFQLANPALAVSRAPAIRSRPNPFRRVLMP